MGVCSPQHLFEDDGIREMLERNLTGRRSMLLLYAVSYLVRLKEFPHDVVLHICAFHVHNLQSLIE